MSILTKLQYKTYGPRFYTEDGQRYKITATVRHDDRCGNGHNTFSITGETWRKADNGHWYEGSGGCIHEQIAQHFPELAPFIRWHLVSTDGPLHYVANTLYWLGFSGWNDGKPSSPPSLEHARNTAVWHDMPDRFLRPDPDARSAEDTPLAQHVRQALVDRHAALMSEFRAAVESLGFTY